MSFTNKRKKREILNTDILNNTPTRPVFVTELVSSYNDWVFKELKQAQITNKWEYVWTKNNRQIRKMIIHIL